MNPGWIVGGPHSLSSSAPYSSPSSTAFTRTSDIDSPAFAQLTKVLQLANLFLLVAIFVTPISEYFDRWDPPGLSHDTEFRVFVLVLTLVFVLVVCRLIASLALRLRQLATKLLQPPDDLAGTQHDIIVAIFIPPRLATPLRI